METKADLNRISIVLVDTKTPANIGATARCMMNMGLSRLVLVRPPLDRTGEARKLAAGAEKVLEGAVVHASLREAVAGDGLVIGASRHAGRLRKNIRPPREAAALVVPLLARNSASVVFGNEVNGLENDDLALCHEIVSIPSSEQFPSLNLSHAVLVVAYELFLASGDTAAGSVSELVRHEDLEHFYAHLQKTLTMIGFLEEDNPNRMMFGLRQLFGRARMSSRDVGVLRGILSSIDRMGSR